LFVLRARALLPFEKERERERAKGRKKDQKSKKKKKMRNRLEEKNQKESKHERVFDGAKSSNSLNPFITLRIRHTHTEGRLKRRRSQRRTHKMGLNKRRRKEDEGESSSSYSTSSDDDENDDENKNKTTMNVEEFGFERVEKLTGRRLKQEKLNKKKQKSGGFESMDLPPDIFRAIKRKGYRLPTPIQRKAIPVISTGVDVVAMARTGSGKTAAFVVPVLAALQKHSLRNGARALILAPTRELALQTFAVTRDMAKFTDLRLCALVGGDSMEMQFEDLANNPDVIVATPGRVLHHTNEIESFSLRLVEKVVLDEADRLLEMGFQDQLSEIMKKVSQSRQTLLFSATLPSALAEFVKVGLRDPRVIRLDAEMKISEDLRLTFALVRKEEKIAALLRILQTVVENEKSQTVVFASTRHHVEHLETLLKKEGHSCVSIFGAMDFAARKIALATFKSGKANVMVVTDVAARGIDVPLLDNVINYDFPANAKLFVHRVGRVARAGRKGIAHSILVKEELGYVVDLHLFLGRKIKPADIVPPQNEEEAEKRAREGDANEESVVGTFPIGSLDLLADRVRELHETHIELEALQKTTVNAYKAYQKTRIPASSESVARAKPLIECGPHPLFCAAIFRKASNAGGTANTTTYKNAKELAELMRGMKNYRPHATVLEAEFASAGKIGKNWKSSVSVNAMSEKRKAHAKFIEMRNNGEEKTKKLRPLGDDENPIVAGNTHADDDADDDDDGSDDDSDNDEGNDDDDDDDERVNGVDIGAGGGGGSGGKKKLKTLVSQDAFSRGKFRDDEFFMDVVPRKINHKELGLSTKEGCTMDDLDEMTMDIVAEDGASMRKQKKLVSVWDKKKKNYVQVDANEIGKNGKRIKNESGKVVSKDTLGKTYKKWQSKTNRYVSQVGEVEDEKTRARYDKKKRAGASEGGGMSRFKRHFHTKGTEGGGNGSGNNAPSELRNADQIRKGRKEDIRKKRSGRGGGRSGGRGGGRSGGRGGRGKGRK
jgi:ATP-dependent RNA helicase DDX54/DBP10